MEIELFSDIKNLSTSEETKIYLQSWKEHIKIRLTTEFGIKWGYYGHAMSGQFVYISF